MRKHLSEGELRLSLDGEADPGQAKHLESCAACRARREEMRLQSQRVARRLSFLSPAQERAPAAQTAWNRLAERIQNHKENSMFKKWFAFPVVRFAATAALLLTIILVIPGTRALAEELLNLFRIQQVAVIPVDFTGLEQLTGGASGRQFSELISKSIEMIQKPGDPVPVADAAEASQAAGFNVRLPESPVPSQMYVTNASEFAITVDQKKAQALLDEAGRSDLVLPESIDGARITAHIPAAVSTAYGTCPKPQEDVQRNSDDSAIPGRLYPDCSIFVQIPSPSIDAPADVDVSKLAEIALEFTGMSPDEAAAFTSTVDWTSTLVVPIPKNAATYQQVQVDGVTGTLIQRPADDAPQFALLWVKDGIVYAISGLGTNSAQAIDIANSLP